MTAESAAPSASSRPPRVQAGVLEECSVWGVTDRRPLPAGKLLDDYVVGPCSTRGQPGRALERRATGLAGSWPGVDWQTGGGALEVAVEHYCQRTLPVMMSLGGGQRGTLPRCAGLP
jgi:hypothetical protein